MHAGAAASVSESALNMIMNRIVVSSSEFEFGG
jgi:hypothetical protein